MFASVKTVRDLRELLARSDGRNYGAYKSIRGGYRISDVDLFIDRVQGDPFASPSMLRVRLHGDEAIYPKSLWKSEAGPVALTDLLARRFREAIRAEPFAGGGSGKSGRVSVDSGNQEILERSAVRLGPDFVEVRVRVGLPARGRRILGSACAALLCEHLPRLSRLALARRDPDVELECFLAAALDQAKLREQLGALGLVAFIADGAVLPRASGHDDGPMPGDQAVVTRAPESLACELELSDGGTLRGLGIPKGVTLIVGGGFHGKSTLLQALARCVYPHIPGDGRESCVTDPSAVSIRAEDGRRVAACDISDFIRDLPGGRKTDDFFSEDASGSTSQAASLCEALEVGARVLLMDEDSCATNFMTRDVAMQDLVAAEHEPIVPFVQRVRELYTEQGISTILVMGASGDFFAAADCVIELRDFELFDRSAAAREIAAIHPAARSPALPGLARCPMPRIPSTRGLDPGRGNKRLAVEARELRRLHYGEAEIDLSAVAQLLDSSQTRAIGYALATAGERFVDGRRTLPEILDALEALAREGGLAAWVPGLSAGAHPGELAHPRRAEIAAAWNRLRGSGMGTRARDAGEAKGARTPTEPRPPPV